MPSKARTIFATVGLLMTAACAVQNSDGTVSVASTVPEAVAQVAGPNQDLSFVELRESDNCYWYRHRGPVETTMLPLRTRQGRHICVQREEAPAEA